MAFILAQKSTALCGKVLIKMFDKISSNNLLLLLVTLVVLTLPVCVAANVQSINEQKLPDKNILKSQAATPIPKPQICGFASLYPGDEGIEYDPRVLFVEDFETGTVDEIGQRWGNISKKENIKLSSNIHTSSPGNSSIHISNNGHLFTHTKGVDIMYARFYAKFHEKVGYVHHFVHLVADRTPTPWPKGGAGETPPGDAKFSTGIEPTGLWGKFPPPGIWNFYTYWHQMKTKWGTVFIGKEEPIQPGRWYCVEVMLKANSSPDKADGEQAFWVDGELYGKFTGFRWRTTDKLKINSFWLLFYNTDQPARHNNDPHPESRIMEVWFDDIVIATEYIGPIYGKPKDGKKKATPSKSALFTPGELLPEPGRPVFSQNFDNDAGNFKGGDITNGGANGSRKKREFTL